jgi:WD40 repeat protein
MALSNDKKSPLDFAADAECARALREAARAYAATQADLLRTQLPTQEHGKVPLIVLPSAPVANAPPKPRSSVVKKDTTAVTVRARGDYTLSHSDEVLGIACSPDGRYLFVGGEEPTLVLWDVVAKSKVWTVGGLIPPVTAVAYSPGGVYAASSCGESGTVQIWNLQSRGKECCGSGTMDGEVASLAMATAESKEVLAVGLKTKSIQLFSVPDLDELWSLSVAGEVRNLVFSPGGAALAACSGSDEMRGLFYKEVDHETGDADHRLGKALAVWSIGTLNNAVNCEELVYMSKHSIVHVAAFAPRKRDGRILLAAAGDECIIELFDMDEKKHFVKSSEVGCGSGVRCLAFASEEAFAAGSCILVSSGVDMLVSIFDMMNGVLLFQLPKCQDWLCQIAVLPQKAGDATNSGKVLSLSLATCGHGLEGVTVYDLEYDVQVQPMQFTVTTY